MCFCRGGILRVGLLNLWDVCRGFFWHVRISSFFFTSLCAYIICQKPCITRIPSVRPFIVREYRIKKINKMMCTCAVYVVYTGVWRGQQARRTRKKKRKSKKCTGWFSFFKRLFRSSFPVRAFIPTQFSNVYLFL